MNLDHGKLERAATDDRTFAPLLETCAEYGIARSCAFELARKGILETFKVGRRRMVILESLRKLPEHAGPDGTISLKPDRDAA